jgi:hypothetical protein
MNHERILQLGESFPVELANYRTNWQLSLDGNLSGAEREQYRELAEKCASRIAWHPDWRFIFPQKIEEII